MLGVVETVEHVKFSVQFVPEMASTCLPQLNESAPCLLSLVASTADVPIRQGFEHTFEGLAARPLRSCLGRGLGTGRRSVPLHSSFLVEETHAGAIIAFVIGSFRMTLRSLLTLPWVRSAAPVRL